jgi:hypothetical protein
MLPSSLSTWITFGTGGRLTTTRSRSGSSTARS